MRTHTSRGFIPLVAIVLLGLVAVAGGAIAAFSIHSKTAKKEAQATVVATSTPEQAATTTGMAYSAPVSARVQSSGAGTTQSTPDAPSTPVATIVRPMDAETAQDCQEASVAATDAKANGGYSVTAAKQIGSMLQYILTACNTLKKPSPDTSDAAAAFADQEASIKKQFALYTEVKLREASGQPQNDTPAPAQVPEPSLAPQSNKQTESYAESPTYPTILSFTDNHGNDYKVSDYNGYQGPDNARKQVVLHVGDTIQATVTAKDPRGRSLEYNWNSSSQAFNDVVARTDGAQGSYKYTSNNTLSYTITQADLQSAGQTFRLVYQVRVAGASVFRAGANGYDDTGYVDYTLEQ